MNADGREMPLRRASLQVEAEGGLARSVLRQVFANPQDEPMHVTYSLPLPEDGAVAGYEIRIGARLVRGEIERRAAAREMFERALVEGKTAALLDQERTNLFTLELGNVPPGTEVAVQVTLDQRLAWLPQGMWEWRFPTVAAPRYMGAEGGVPDAERVTVDVADGDTGVRVDLALRIGDTLSDAGLPESPSHAIMIDGGLVRLPCTGAALDRDLVVRWPVARPQPGITLRLARPMPGSPPSQFAYGLLTIVPPAGQPEVLQRDLIVLLDTSGSMAGPPLEQAKRVVSTLLETTGERDTLELIAFSTRPQRWQSRAVRATTEARLEARAWVAGLEAGGGTEMGAAVETALQPLQAGAQRQVVLVTDGLIGGEVDIVRTVCNRLPAGSRLHTVGVGPAVNRALTASGARAGRGVEVLVGLEETAESAAARLVAALRAPVVVDIEITGSAVRACAPRRPTDLMAGAPVTVSLQLAARGGEVIVRGFTRNGIWEDRLQVPSIEPGTGSAAVTTRFGREAVEDLEMALAAGAGPEATDAEITRIGLDFGIATRLTSWVAVSEEPDVDPLRPARRVRMPQMLPHGLSIEGLGLRVSPESRRAAAVQVTCTVTSEQMASALHHLLTPHDAGGEIHGRWLLVSPGGPQVVEVAVLGRTLDWDPDRTVRLELRGGKHKKAKLDGGLTTPSGRVLPGTILRLALSMRSEDVHAVQAIVVRCRGKTLRILL